MPENGDLMEQKQEKAAPTMRDVLSELQDGEIRQTALGFAAYLDERQLTPRIWFNKNYWRIPYGEHFLCSILVDKVKWRVFFFSGDYGGEFEEKSAKTVREYVRPCISCIHDCPKGQEMTVFGEKFENACFQFPVQFVNPDGGVLECIKGLLEYWKEAAPRSDSWHAR